MCANAETRCRGQREAPDELKVFCASEADFVGTRNQVTRQIEKDGEHSDAFTLVCADPIRLPESYHVSVAI